MQTITTNHGKNVVMLTQFELRDPRTSGEYVRAYCHIHGSDHQRSLSIRRSTGWGHCFNATCDATVLVTDWNPTLAAHLLHHRETHDTSVFTPATTLSDKRLPRALQPILLHIPPQVPQWQQDEQNILLNREEQLHLTHVRSQRAQAYLAERGISMQVAQQAGVGYLAPDVIPQFSEAGQRSLVRRWAARMLFPLLSPYGRGYIGRSLWQWRSGMNEQVHKALLEQEGGPKRWIKTNPAGWFCAPFEHFASHIILVEGAFDRLALLNAGFAPNEVVALAGTALQIDWLPPQVETIVLALDNDQGGQEATQRLATQLKKESFNIQICSQPQDKWGKDWNERWRILGPLSIRSLRKTCSLLRSA